MRILIAHNRYQVRGGEDIVVDRELALLKSAGIEVDFFEVKNSDIKSIPEKIEAALSTSYSKKYRQLLEKRIASFKPDVVHVHNSFPLLSASLFDACLSTGTPVVQTLHNYRLFCANGLLLRNGKPCEQCLPKSSFPAVVHRCYRGSLVGSAVVAKMIAGHRAKKTYQTKVGRFIALSQFSKEKFIEGGLPAEKITVKPNFISDPATNAVSGPERFKNFKCLYVGRLSSEKGIQTLLGAWSKLPFELDVVGQGNDLLQKPSKNVRFLGPKSEAEVFKLMSQASLLIVPSECYENFPLVLVEAFAHGLPVLASRIGALKELVQEGVTGAFFETGNANSLQTAVTKLAAQALHLAELGKNARKQYEVKYTDEKNIQMLLEVYRSVLGKER